jgi:hypothetical protein
VTCHYDKHVGMLAVTPPADGNLEELRALLLRQGASPLAEMTVDLLIAADLLHKQVSTGAGRGGACGMGTEQHMGCVGGDCFWPVHQSHAVVHRACNASTATPSTMSELHN